MCFLSHMVKPYEREKNSVKLSKRVELKSFFLPFLSISFLMLCTVQHNALDLQEKYASLILSWDLLTRKAENTISYMNIEYDEYD